MDLFSKQHELIGNLNLIADPQERLSVVVSKGTGQGLPDELKTKDHLVPGCVSRVWVVGSHSEGFCDFRCDAESPMVKGLVSLLCDLYSGSTPEEIVEVEPEIWAKCGFDRLLSPTRMNGLKSVRARILQLATQMQTPTQSAP